MVVLSASKSLQCAMYHLPALAFSSSILPKCHLSIFPSFHLLIHLAVQVLKVIRVIKERLGSQWKDLKKLPQLEEKVQKKPTSKMDL